MNRSSRNLSFPARTAIVAAAFLVVALVPAPASATFHFMQIEQVAGRFCGDPGAQAIQLRMRAGGQSQLSAARLVVRDAAGANPIVLIAFPGNVANAALGSNILIATQDFIDRAHTSGADFQPSAAIPLSYLAAGRLTFEDAAGTTIYWSLSWGGLAYTGPTTGSTTNDADGDFGPSFAGSLLAPDDTAVQFQGAASALSTTNAADYAVSASPATFTDNAGTAVAIGSCLFYDGFESGNTAAWSSAVP